jgi:hypothetical protein
LLSAPREFRGMEKTYLSGLHYAPPGSRTPSLALGAASQRFTTSPTPRRSPLAGEQNQIFTRSISIAEATKRPSLKARAQPSINSALYVGSITSQRSRVLITRVILVSSTGNPKRKHSLAASSGLHRTSFLVFRSSSSNAHTYTHQGSIQIEGSPANVRVESCLSDAKCACGLFLNKKIAHITPSYIDC